MKKFLKKYWSGGVSLPISFWSFSVFGLFIAGMPISLAIDYAPESAFWFFILYVLLFFIFVIFVWVGLWRSARNYIVKKEKKGLSPIWGRGAQVWIVLSIIGLIKRIIFG